jgi:hypothetical protein
LDIFLIIWWDKSSWFEIWQAYRLFRKRVLEFVIAVGQFCLKK